MKKFGRGSNLTSSFSDSNGALIGFGQSQKHLPPFTPVHMLSLTNRPERQNIGSSCNRNRTGARPAGGQVRWLSSIPPRTLPSAMGAYSYMQMERNDSLRPVYTNSKHECVVRAVFFAQCYVVFRSK
jgi:hypothetical protein